MKKCSNILEVIGFGLVTFIFSRRALTSTHCEDNSTAEVICLFPAHLLHKNELCFTKVLVGFIDARSYLAGLERNFAGSGTWLN
uniref:Uncharacterized protein n=1 Tax=Candidatus Kentrum sp. FW TaxID=2126338 RepID=A0A450THA2_9GAMM|nr:MAG: hypothetical protein BECKFW1821C_GA0114237_101026 [Candidatus Kentron sp. FW]